MLQKRLSVSMTYNNVIQLVFVIWTLDLGAGLGFKKNIDCQ